MPLKLSVGVSRKQGLPNFGSVGATCLVELELPFDALRESAGFFEQADKAREACRTIVDAELARHSNPSNALLRDPALLTPPQDETPPALSSLSASMPPTQSQLAPEGALPRLRASDRSATPRQLQAIERLTLKLGGHAGDWLHERIGETPPHCLSLAEASALIDELQQQFPPRLAG